MRRFCTAVLLALLAARLPAQRPPDNAFRFSILGDRTGGANQKAYEQAWREIDRLRPDFIVNVGDTIEGGNDATAAAEWTALRALWKSYKYQQFFTPGNHDIWSPTSRRIFGEQTGHAPPYSFDHQNAHFTVLDNSQTETLDDGQLQFLERDLAENRARTPKFVLFHKPFWLLPLKFDSGEFPLHKLALKYGVNCVISGHGHQFVRLARDGVVYLEVGSSGGNLKGLDRGEGYDQGWFYQHVLVEVRGGKIEATVHELGPPLGQGRSVRLEYKDHASTSPVPSNSAGPAAGRAAAPAHPSGLR
ncbi:MAG: metallophosphoesterase [Acidobacteriota bacterium]|nr:metallophosphoesterase [Acidobacteriota bacterium]